MLFIWKNFNFFKYFSYFKHGLYLYNETKFLNFDGYKILELNESFGSTSL